MLLRRPEARPQRTVLDQVVVNVFIDLHAGFHVFFGVEHDALPLARLLRLAASQDGALLLLARAVQIVLGVVLAVRHLQRGCSLLLAHLLGLIRQTQAALEGRRNSGRRRG